MFNPLTWFADFVQGAANGIANAYASLLIEIVKILVNTSLQSPARLRSPWFMTGLGGTYELARFLVGVVAIIVCAYAVLTPTRAHGKKLSSVISSIFYVGLFAVAFFPVYGLIVTGSKGIVQALLNLAQGAPNATAVSLSNAITAAGLPANSLGKLITAGLAAALGAMALVESFAMQIWLVFLFLFYPLVIALRPLGRPAIAIFNACNAAIATIVLSLPVMAFGLIAPVLGRNFVPFGDTGVAAFAFTVLGGLFALVTPLIMFVFFYKKSSEVFGSIESNVGGRIDIASMPSVTTREMNDSVDDSHRSAIKEFATSVALGAATADLGNSDDLMGDLKSLAVEGGSVAAAASGHVEIAAVLNTFDTTTSKENRAHEAREHESANSPEGGEM